MQISFAFCSWLAVEFTNYLVFIFQVYGAVFVPAHFGNDVFIKSVQFPEFFPDVVQVAENDFLAACSGGQEDIAIIIYVYLLDLCAPERIVFHEFPEFQNLFHPACLVFQCAASVPGVYYQRNMARNDGYVGGKCFKSSASSA